MSDYGLTSSGINIKRLDTILEEMHTDLTKAWGVNTRQNPESLLNALLTNIADEIAELWELGMDVYNSTYPTTAEGLYLDNAAQFAGVSREEKAKSFYSILCTGTEGTVIPKSTLIQTDTNPATELLPTAENTMSRTDFNQAVIRAVTIDGNPLTILLDSTSYSVTPAKGTSVADAMAALLGTLSTASDFSASLDSSSNIVLKATSETASHTMVLSDNLTTDKIGCVYQFATEEYGNIYLPNGSVTVIVKAVTGLESVTNVGTYVAGRLEENDIEFRKSYMDKIFSHSSRMIESVKSAILTNCQGAESVAVYENYTDSTDSAGRYPHSIEVVCDGGDDDEIAQQILNTKAGGINTYGSTVVTVHGDYEDEITIRFNRPEKIKIWFHVVIHPAQGQTIVSNYAELIRSLICDVVGALECGDDVIPQSSILPVIYSGVYGIDYIEVTMATGDTTPTSYDLKNVYLTERQRAAADESRIEVVISNG